MRKKKSLKNLMFGFVYQFVLAGLGLVNRTFFIKFIGIEALGLNGLFTEVLSMLSLAEMGIGAAITYSLYKPLSEDDHDQISKLVNLFSKAYHIVAAAIMLIGIVLTPFIQYFINGISYPLPYIRLIFLMFVFQTASSYLFSYLGALITADQKRYIISSVSIVAQTAQSIVQLLVLFLTKNYVAYLACSIVFTLLSNITASIIAHKMYPYLDKKQKLSKDEQAKIFSDVKNVFVSRISGVITNSTDNTLISVLVGTISVGLYNNYYTIIKIFKGLITQVTNATTASYGNLLATESGERCSVVLQNMTYMSFVFSGVCSTGLFCCLSRLISVWLGPEFLLDEFTVFICVVCLSLNIIRTPLWTALDVSGLFKENSFVGIVGSVFNLLVSIVLGKYIGMAGIFMGTITTYLIQGSMKIRYLYKKRFGLDATKYYLKTARYIVIVMAQMLTAKYVTETVCSQISNQWLALIGTGIIAVILSLLVDVLPFIKSKEFSYMLSTVSSILKKNKRG